MLLKVIAINTIFSEKRLNRRGITMNLGLTIRGYSLPVDPVTQRRTPECI